MTHNWEFAEHGYIILHEYRGASSIVMPSNVGEYTTYIDCATGMKKHIIKNINYEHIQESFEEDGKTIKLGYPWEGLISHIQVSMNVKKKFWQRIMHKEKLTFTSREWLK